MGTEQNVQEIEESNKLKGDLTADNALALQGGQQLKPEDIAAEQKAEEDRLRAEAAAESSRAGEQQVPVTTGTPGAQLDYFGAPTETKEQDAGAIDLKSGKYVPVEEHAKLRKRAQAAEQRAAELEQTLTAGAAAGEAEIQLDDDVPVEGKVVKQLLANQERAIIDKVTEVLSQRDQQLAASIAANQAKNRLVVSQNGARSKLADYDAVIQTAKEHGVLLQSEVEAAKREANPGMVLYLFAKRNLAALGIQVKASAGKSPGGPAKSEQENQSAEGEEILSPQALFDGALSGKLKAAG
jgi:hypothetical protein